MELNITSATSDLTKIRVNKEENRIAMANSEFAISVLFTPDNDTSLEYYETV